MPSHVEEFERGAWVGNPDKRCPKCGVMAHFASDFTAVGGKHQVRVCVPCGAVYDNGKEKGVLLPVIKED